MNIMIAYDDSPHARHALERTLEMFSRLEPMIILIGVAEESLDTSSSSEANYINAKNEFSARIKGAAEEVGYRGLNVEVVIGQGDARKVILKAVNSLKPDLLVVSRHCEEPGEGFIAHSIDALVDEFNYMTFGSVSSFLVRRAPCPVLVQVCPVSARETTK